jgi:hypothetical protein
VACSNHDHARVATSAAIAPCRSSTADAVLVLAAGGLEDDAAGPASMMAAARKLVDLAAHDDGDVAEVVRVTRHAHAGRVDHFPDDELAQLATPHLMVHVLVDARPGGDVRTGKMRAPTC